MPNFEVDYSYKDKLCNVTSIYADTVDEVPAQFDKYVNETYLMDLAEEEQPSDFFIEGIMEVKDGK